jgi:MFS family permease
MLPVANALLAEIMPTRHRGWCLVLIGGIGTVGGYFATSAASALLQPFFGWPIMWLIGFPTGLILIALSPFLPESVRFLLEMGRVDEARQMLARYGAVLATDPHMSASGVGKTGDQGRQQANAPLPVGAECRIHACGPRLGFCELWRAPVAAVQPCR